MDSEDILIVKPAEAVNAVRMVLNNVSVDAGLFHAVESAKLARKDWRLNSVLASVV